MTDPADGNLLGRFLKDRRGRLDPAALGFAATRRRTPGLRREEVAQRADVSAIWYTWLEQGRHANPSTDLLDRLAGALQLTDTEREHLFLLAQRRPPAMRRTPSPAVTPGLQRLLDSLEHSPALVKNAAWDVLAWNRAAAVVLTDYGALAPERRNLLRLLFGDPAIRERCFNWQDQARHVVATFRLETARTGGCDDARALVEELNGSSADFAAMWREHDVSNHGEGVKHIDHPVAGPIVLDYASFTVDGRADLSLLIYTPAGPADTAAVRSLLAGRTASP